MELLGIARFPRNISLPILSKITKKIWNFEKIKYDTNESERKRLREQKVKGITFKGKHEVGEKEETKNPISFLLMSLLLFSILEN